MTRITLDGFVLRFPRTGIVNYVFNILQLLGEQPSLDISVLVGDLHFTDKEIAAYIARSGVRTRIVDDFPPTDPQAIELEALRDRGLAAKLPRPIEIARVVAPGDIYHSTDWYHYSAPHARLNMLTYHDLSAYLFPQFHEYTNIEKEKRKGEAAKEFDHIVADSNSTRNDVIRLLGIPEERVTTIHLGVDSIYEWGAYAPREQLLKKYKIEPSARYVLSVSTIEPRKNTIGILETFKALCAISPSYRDLRLVLSGHMGWRNTDLHSYLETYPYRDNVSFTGYLDLQDMPSLYHHAEAFLYLSHYEGFGIPILEAMKSECPVVCSNTSSMPEVVGDCGELVSPSSADEAAVALARILDNPTYANSLRFSAFSRSRQFTWRRHVDQLLTLYEELA